MGSVRSQGIPGWSREDREIRECKGNSEKQGINEEENEWK